MKRTQFSLRLLLLVTALIASIVGWQVAIRNRKQSDLDYRLKILHGKLDDCRANIKRIEDSRFATFREGQEMLFNLRGDEAILKGQVDYLEHTR
jgi:hypothetical protein